MKTEHAGLPVAGYKPTQSQEAIDLVDEGKILEERVLRYIEKVAESNGTRGDTLGGHSGRYLNIGKTDSEKGFMMVFRSVFQPNGSRISLPEDRIGYRTDGHTI